MINFVSYGLKDQYETTGLHVDIEIVDEENRVLPRGSEGVIRVRTPGRGRPFNASSGSFEKLDPETGWLYLGDRGLVRADGLLVVTEHPKENIKAEEVPKP